MLTVCGQRPLVGGGGRRRLVIAVERGGGGARQRRRGGGLGTGERADGRLVVERQGRQRRGQLHRR